MKGLPYYLFVVAVGGLVGLLTSVASGMQLKWLIVFLGGMALLSAFALTSHHRRLALGLFTLFITIFMGKQIFSSGYKLITGGPSSLGLFLYDIPLAVLVLIFIKERMYNRRGPVYIPPVFYALACFILWGVVSIINSVEPVLTFIEVLWLCKMAVILLMMVNLVKDKKDLFLVIAVLMAGLFMQEIITFAQSYLKEWFTFTGDVEQSTFQEGTYSEVFRAGGTVGPHNVQSAYYVLLIPLAAGIFFSLRQKTVRFVLLPLIAAGILALVLTYSRNGYLSLTVAMIVFAVIGWRKKIINRRHLFAGFWGISVTCLIIFILIGDSLVARISSTAAVVPRLEGMEIALNMVRQHPIAGVGLNNFSVAMGDTAYSPEGISSMQRTFFGGEFVGTVVHNKFLLVASQMGIVGFMIFIWTMYIIYLYAIKLLKGDRFYAGIGIGMTAALAGASVQMMFDIYNSDILITIFWVLVGVIFVSSRISAQEEKLQAGPTSIRY
jgi:putative inorganic carbon (HCO3(-)) transporter